MEKANNVHVYCSDFGWADLGTWGSLYEHKKLDKNKNAISGKKVLSYDLENCIVSANDEKLVVVQGLKDYIIVDTDDVLMICKKENEQDIKQYVNDIKLKLGDKYI